MLLAVLATAGCDSSAVLANIDTYTCAYLPGAVDCTTQEVHDRAVNLLEHGLTRAHAECALGSPGLCAPGYASLKYNMSLLQDGACFASSSGNTTAPFQPNMVNASGFTPRGDARPCTTLVAGNSSNPSTSLYVSAGFITDGGSCSFDIATHCTGFGLEAFGELP